MDPREQAAAILRESRFHSSTLPRPLHGVLQTLGGWLAPVGNWFLAKSADVVAFFSGHPLLAALLMAVVVLCAAARLATLRHRRIARAGKQVIGGVDSPDPVAMRRRANDAELLGDSTTAVRLYFQAAILELQVVERLPRSASLTIGEARRRLASADFEVAARSFESVVYGLRDATGSDVAAVKGDWWERIMAPTS